MLAASLLGNMLADKGNIRAVYGYKRKRIITFMDLKKHLIPPHPLRNFEMQKYYQNEPRFNDVYS